MPCRAECNPADLRAHANFSVLVGGIANLLSSNPALRGEALFKF
jgi:hypothetical protein